MDPPCNVRALYEYRSEHADDLNFDAGQIIRVHAVEDEEWLNGTYTSSGDVLHTGMFPKSFVELIQPKASAPPAAPAHPTAANSAPAATHSEPAQSPGHQSTDQESFVQIAPARTEELPARVTSDMQDQIVERSATMAIDQSNHTIPAQHTEDVSTNPTTKTPDSQPRPDSASMVGDTEAMTKPRDSSSTLVPATVSEQNSTVVDHRADVPPPAQQAQTSTSVLSTTGRHALPSSLDTPKVQSKPEVRPEQTSQTSNIKSPPSEKPVRSNAFKDRIAAFNKQEAAPIAPKPMPKPNLAKKPFVAPPPAKDAYLYSAGPLKPKPLERPPHLDKQGSVPTPVNADKPESSKAVKEPPKVGSLKDRIAALQAEQSQIAAKKTAPQKPSEVPTSAPMVAQESEVLTDEAAHETSSGEAHLETQPQSSPPRSMPAVPMARQISIDESEQVPHSTSPAPLFKSDTDPSVGPIRVQPTGASVQSQMSSLSVLASPPVPTVPSFTAAHDLPRDHSPIDTSPDTAAAYPPSTAAATDDSNRVSETTVEGNEVVSEDELDEEDRRKQQLRERMAKMSGGMGIGMHMALGLGGGRSTKPKPAAKATSHVGEQETVHQAPIPMPGLQPMMAKPAPVTQTVDIQHLETGTLNNSEPVTASVPEELANSTHVSRTEAPPPPPVEPPQSMQIASPPAVLPARPLPVSRVSLESVPEVSSHLGSLSIESHSDAPPPIPSGRPVMSLDRNAPPAIPTSRPSMEIEHVTSPVPEVVPLPIASRGAPPIPNSRPSMEYESTPMALPSLPAVSARQSIDSVRGPPPPVPSTMPPVPTHAPANPPRVPSPQLQSPSSMTPGGSRRMSYFGTSTSPAPSLSRPSIDMNVREVDQSRASFDSFSRTNSARIDPPSRPPPPSIPNSRAPPPPVPVNSPPSRMPTAPPRPMAPTPGVPYEEDEDYYTSSPPLPSGVSSFAPLDAQTRHVASFENEREGYEADDDITENYSSSRMSFSETVPTSEVGSPSISRTGTLERSATKKNKGIKGMFKRKDKDSKNPVV